MNLVYKHLYNVILKFYISSSDTSEMGSATNFRVLEEYFFWYRFHPCQLGNCFGHLSLSFNEIKN